MRVPLRDDPPYVIGVVSGGHFLSHVYLLAYPPLFPLLRTEFDVTTTQLGLLVTAIYVPTLLFQLPLGELVDRIGAKRVLVAGMGVTALGIVLSGLAPTYGILLGCAFLSGIGQSVFHPANYALLETVTTDGTEGKAFSAHTFGGFAGFAAAPVLLGTVGIVYRWQLALFLAGVLGFLYAGLLLASMAPVHRRTILTPAASPGTDQAVDGDALAEGDTGPIATIRASFAFLRVELVLIAGFYLVSMMAIVGLQSFTTVLGVSTFGFSESTANTVLTAYLVATAIGVVVGGPLVDVLPVDRTILGLFVLAAALVTTVVVRTPTAGVIELLALFTAIGLLMGAALPSRDKLANSFVDAEETGKSFGFFFSGLSLGAVTAPVIIGTVIDHLSAAAGFALITVFLLGAAGVVSLVRLVARTRS